VSSLDPNELVRSNLFMTRTHLTLTDTR